MSGKLFQSLTVIVLLMLILSVVQGEFAPLSRAISEPFIATESIPAQISLQPSTIMDGCSSIQGGCPPSLS